jgi:hypothetical protein
MREQALGTSYVTDINERDLFAKHQPIFSVDFLDSAQLEVHAEKAFEIYRDGEINGVAFWFDAKLTDTVRLSSGPWTKTHWKQCFTPLTQPRKVFAGELLAISFSMTLCERKSDRFSFTVEIPQIDDYAA